LQDRAMTAIILTVLIAEVICLAVAIGGHSAP
jgi:hypothetical protein